MNRIVVIEDDPAILSGLEATLRSESYDVLTARDGEDGYRLVQERQPDLVILDLMLPKMNGYDVCGQSGGTPETLIENYRDSILSLSWTANDTILFASKKGILEIPSARGAPMVLIEGADGEVLSHPELLPDKETLMFSATTATGINGWDSAKIFVQPLRSDGRQFVWNGGADARYIQTGHIIYVQGSKLFAIPFDLDSLRRMGEPVPIIEGMRRSSIGTPITPKGCRSLARGSATALPLAKAPADLRTPAGVRGVPQRLPGVSRLALHTWLNPSTAPRC